MPREEEMARILIIEDNQANLDLMTYLLEAFGHTTLCAVNGEAGLEAAERENPDLVVCDLQLPKVDGYEVARRLKSRPHTRAIPLVAVTAYAMVGDRDGALAAGFDGYLSKPIIPETFVRQVEDFLTPEQRSGKKPPAAEQSPTPTPPAQRATILVVDDSPINLSLISSTLEPFGYQIIPAGSVREALDIARRQTPDMILSDLHMPERDGFDLFLEVKNHPRLGLVPFVLISSSVWGDKDRIRALELGATKFISRPIEPQTLLAEVEACLRQDTSGKEDS